MNSLNGYKIDIGFGELTKVSDLIYFDGPLLSHYISKKGDDLLFYWVDADAKFNRWLVIRTNVINIQSYIDRKTSLFQLVTESLDSFVYAVDINDKLEFTNIQIVETNKLPNDYLPSQDSFYVFDVEGTTDLLSLSKRYNSGVLELYIDGSHVGYGTMPFHNFVTLLNNIEDIRKSLSTKYIKLKVTQKGDRNGISKYKKELNLDYSI